MLGKSAIWCVAFLALPVSIGCGGGQSRLAAPGVAGDASEAAIAEYDSNGDGVIGGNELDQCPALQSSLRRADLDGDGKVSADEIDKRIAVWKNSGLALTRLAVTVKQGGQPVSDAEVTFVPESFLGPSIKQAQGVTDSDGVAHMRISSDPDEAGVHLGYYRVQVSKKLPNGKETLSASNNAQTKHGVEIAPDDPRMSGVTLNLLGD